MKTLVVTTPYWENSPGGGILTYLSNLVNELVRKGITVKVVFMNGIDQENYSIKGSRFLYPFKAFLVLRKIKPEIIHSQNTWYCLLAGVVYKKSSGARLIHTFHSAPSKKLPIYGRIFLQYLLNQCNYITFVSNALRDEIQDIWRLKFKNTEITYAGVSPREISHYEMDQFRINFGLRKNCIVLLAQAFTANQMKAAGVKVLMESVRVLSSDYPNIFLILTREGFFSNQLKRFAVEIGLESQVIFTGNIKNPYVPLAICDIYTHISLAEGLPIALLEAMSMGKPIIASEVGGIPEAIINMENGLLVKPDVSSIVEALLHLLKDKELATKLGNNAKTTAAKVFALDQFSDKFIRIYEGNS